MIRSQILLTKELNKLVKSIAKNDNISQSEVVRKLLSEALDKSGSGKVNKVTDQYIYDLEEHNEQNPRIDGFKEIYSVGGKITPVKILGHKLFEFYLKNKKLPKDVSYKIAKYANEFSKLSNTKELVLRRAYVVSDIENPPGPRFIGIKPEEIERYIFELYDFAIKHNYHNTINSRICGFFYPFADPKPLSFPLEANAKLPYGGSAIPLNRNSSRVEVLAVWGNNEGVQSFDAIDSYIVNTDRMIILEKNIPQKNIMLVTTRRKQSDEEQVPLDKQFEQVLSDAEIIETARIVKELSKKYGLRRIEFSYDGVDSLIYNESAPYEIKTDIAKHLKIVGNVFAIKSNKDVEKVREFDGSDVNNNILCVDRSIVRGRNYDLLNNIASLSSKFTILYPSLSANAHAMRILSDFGHTAIAVGNRDFANGEKISIKTDETGTITIDTFSDENLSKYLVNLYDAKLYGTRLVGGKATNLSVLKSKGFNVAHGFVLTTNFFDEVVSATLGVKVTEELNNASINLKDINKYYKRTFVVADELWKKVKDSFKINNSIKYAVRSSANVEDQRAHSFAGQFETYLNVEPNELKENVLKVIKSMFNQNVARYFVALERKWDCKMAVVLQEMVDAYKSGVIFSKDIQTENNDLIVIEAKLGLADGVVDGVSKSEKIVYSRDRATIVNKYNYRKGVLNMVEINALVNMIVNIEQLMGGSQDIEWAIDKEGRLWIVQARGL